MLVTPLEKIGFGGGCHWCTEGVFNSLIGVEKVEQGWISSTEEHQSFSEAVIVHYNPSQIDLSALIEIHLHTHSSTSNHSMRAKYRSAVYSFDSEQKKKANGYLDRFQKDFDEPLITKVLPFREFKLNKEDQLNYFFKQPENTFCKRYIHPKLELLNQRFAKQLNHHKLKEINL